MDGAALTPMDLARHGVWQPGKGEVDGPRRQRQTKLAGQHPCGNHCGPGWRDSVGIFGCPAGGSWTDGAIKPGTEQLAAGPGHD